MGEAVDLYGMFRALEDQLKERFPNYSRSVEDCRQSLALAIGYVWGREDAGDRKIIEVYGREVQASWEFGYMYGIVCLMYKLEMIYSKPSVCDAFAAFRASRDLREYVHEGK
jgi:hypothetical protein